MPGACSLPASAPSRPTRWLLYAVGCGVWVSGVLWWIFDRYLLQQTDYGIAQRPLQVWWLRTHAALATVLVWLVGYLSGQHVQRNWPSRLRRVSGLLFLAVLGVLLITGYLLYYVEADRPLALISTIHWGLGTVTPLAYLLHRGLRRGSR